MKKKLFLILLVVVLCLATAFPVCAAENEGFADEYYRVIDMAGLLTESDALSIIEKLDEISLRQNMDVVIATTDDLEGLSVREYADLLYESCNFGYGSSKDGLMLLISMEGHDWWISTSGYGITAFTDVGIQYIGEQITPSLSNGDYNSAFEKYAELCDEFITQARQGAPYDVGSLPKNPLSVIWIPISLVVGFIVAKVVVGNMKAQLKTVRSQATADSFVKGGSMNVTDRRDLFLYHTVTKTPRPKNTSSGSSTHRSSSGTTHGGGGGKF